MQHRLWSPRHVRANVVPTPRKLRLLKQELSLAPSPRLHAASIKRNEAEGYCLRIDVGNSVLKAIDDWTLGELDAAMMHASNAVDGTARKIYPDLANKAPASRDAPTSVFT
jgi:hypothetical protein